MHLLNDIKLNKYNYYMPNDLSLKEIYRSGSHLEIKFLKYFNRFLCAINKNSLILYNYYKE